MKEKLDLRLYLVTDRALSKGRSLEKVVLAAVQGGVTIVQLREKECTTREFVALAIKVKELLDPLKVPLIINDRLDVALAVKADGIHLGQSDMPYRIAREILGKNAIIGLSVESIQDAQEAEDMDVDYLGISPVFLTPTKTDLTKELGLDGIRKIKAFSRHKLVAIGGINGSNAKNVIYAGADGIAVVSAICSAENPHDAAKSLLKIIHAAQNYKEQ